MECVAGGPLHPATPTPLACIPQRFLSHRNVDSDVVALSENSRYATVYIHNIQ